MKKILSATFALTMAVFLCSCGLINLGGEEEPTQNADAGQVPPPLAPPGAAAPPIAPPGQQVAAVQPGQPGQPVATPVPGQPAAQAAPAYQWTQTPGFHNIPEAPIAASFNNNPVTINSIVFEADEDQWNVFFADTQLTDNTAPINQGQYGSIQVPQILQTGSSVMAPMDPQKLSTFQVATDPNNPNVTAPWMTQASYAIQITSWNAADFKKGGSTPQVAGTASGRIAVSLMGSGGIQNSWIAGTFDNAVIRYGEKPKFLAKKAKGEKAGGNNAQKFINKAKRQAKNVDPDEAKAKAADIAKKNGIQPIVRPRPMVIRRKPKTD